MFLALTADHRFWKKDEKILFLGEWCRLYRNREIWTKLDSEVFPYHWDDREKLYRDYLYLDELYETCFIKIAKRMNEIHNVDRSDRYWRIIIGPWLYHFIQILYDRYLSVSSVINSKKDIHTWLPRLEPAIYIPQDFDSFGEYVVGDGYNHYLYGRIIAKLGRIPYQIKDFEMQFNFSRRKISLMNKGKLLAKNIFGYLAKVVPSCLNKVVFVSSYLNPLDIFRLQASLGQIPCPIMPMLQTENIAIDLSLRNNLRLNLGESPFEKILQELLFEQIPAVYLEGFSTFNHKASSAYPRKPRVIYTANGVISQEGFKFWAAAQVESGAKLEIGRAHV